MSMASVTNSTIRVHSEVLGRFVELRKYTYEEFKTNILDSMSFEDMESIVYIQTVTKGFMVKPGLLSQGPPGQREALATEIFGLIVEEHPFVALDKVKEVVVEEALYEREMPTNRSRAKLGGFIEEVRSHLYNNVVGQREAIDVCVDAFARGLVRKPSQKRPMASLMFAGLSGVGKTEVAKQLALAIRGGEEGGLVKIDCAEFSEAHYAARLTGSPSGYVGYDDQGLLENKIDGGPQVLLFDEFEKAHPKLHTLLLGAMEDGVITAGNNTEISLSECIIILTSNLGSGEIARGWEHGLGFNPQGGYRKEGVRKAIEKHLPVEFVNRLDDIIVFDELTPGDKREIAALQLKSLSTDFDHLVKVGWDDSLLDWMAAEPKRSEGARAIRKRKDQLNALIAKEVLRRPRAKTMRIGIQDAQLVVS